MDKVWTVEWEWAQSMGNGWKAFRSFEDVERFVESDIDRRIKLLPVTKAMFAEAEGMDVNDPILDSILPAWWNEPNDYCEVKVEEYTEESAGPGRWRMFQNDLIGR